MALNNYPRLEPHKKIHLELKSQVVALSEELKARPAGLSIETIQFLKHWITKHIITIDKSYAPFIKTKG